VVSKEVVVSLFRLDASIRVEGSHSREIADIVEQEWRAAHPDAAVVTRHVGVEPIPATAWAAAVNGNSTPEPSRSPEQRAAMARAAESAVELLDADALLFAVPLYNYGVSQHFKTWVDLTQTDTRVAGGALAGKPAVLVTVRGGGYGAGTPREGWDHATGWMRRILADVWRLDLRVVESELTLAGVNPALDQFKDLAVEIRARAERAAHVEGRELAGALVA
jgi:FMN-dependent NADH-azoreductase